MSVPGYQPMLATSWPSPFSDPAWLFEPKWDWIRAVVRTGELLIRLRGGTDATDRYPELAVLGDRPPAVFDGETRTIVDLKAVPGQLNYQGQLMDASDSSMVTAILEMTFRLFDSEAEASFFSKQVRAATGCRAWEGRLDAGTSNAEAR